MPTSVQITVENGKVTITTGATGGGSGGNPTNGGGDGKKALGGNPTNGGGGPGSSAVLVIGPLVLSQNPTNGGGDGGNPTNGGGDGKKAVGGTSNPTNGGGGPGSSGVLVIGPIIVGGGSAGSQAKPTVIDLGTVLRTSAPVHKP